MAKIRDKLWLWGHEAGSHNNQYGIKGLSRMTAAEAAFYLEVPNLIMVEYKDEPVPPFEQYAMALSPLKRVVWSVVGAGGCALEKDKITLVRDLASRFVNIQGVIMDDFFERLVKDGKKEAALSPEQLVDIQGQLTVSGRKLDLWVVLYNQQLKLSLKEHLEQCDVVTFWTWQAKEIENLERNFERVEKLSPSCRRVLGCYMYDYGESKPMPVHLMEKQCRMGLEWLRQGRIEGIIFLASCICDLGLDAVEWTRRWIQKVGDENLK